MPFDSRNLLALFVFCLAFGGLEFNGLATSCLNAQERMTADQLFKPDRVVDVKIEVAEEDWDTIRKQSREFAEALTKEPAVSPFTYVKANVTIDGVEVKDVGIRKKGFIGSLDNRRPSLKIKFTEYKDQDPIEGADRLTLNNNKQDPSRICQYLSYKMFRDSGTVAPRCGFAKVTVNGKYLGVYSNVEAIKPPFFERGYGDGSGDYFEGTIADFFPDWIQKFEKKNKKAKVKDLKKIVSILAAEEVDLVQLEKYVDIDAFIKYWAMESLIGFWDSYCSNQNNFFIYQNPKNEKFYFVPWGTDSSFTKRSPIPPYRIVPASVHAKAILPNKLYRIPAIQEKYLATLDSFLEEHWNEEKVVAEIDRLEEMLGEHFMDANSQSSRTFKGFRLFVKARRADFARERKNGPPELKSREQTPIYFAEIGTAEVSFATKWYKKTPRKKENLGEADIKLEINGEVVEIEDVAAYAERSKWPAPGGKQPATVVFTGKRKSDGKKITLATSFPDDQFVAGSENAKAGGIYFIDNAFMGPGGGMQMIGGTASFEAASVSDGETVKGKMRLRITQMKMGGEKKKQDGEK